MLYGKVTTHARRFQREGFNFFKINLNQLHSSFHHCGVEFNVALCGA
jgi:hypothetical protein